MMKTRIVVAADRTILVEGMVALLQKVPGFEVVGHAEDGLACLQIAAREQPDIVLVDVLLPGLNGIDLTRRLIQRSPVSRAICIAPSDACMRASAVFEAGAKAYLARTSTFAELLRAIQLVGQDQIYISPQMSRSLIAGLRRAAKDDSAYTRLTSREREIVQLYSEGLSTRQIATRLHLSVKTVGTHRENCMLKLNIQSIAQLTRYAIAQGLSPLDPASGCGSDPSEALVPQRSRRAG
ncbi:LuxR C-terminal-related transcriptional regulator [Xanthomonas arboricola]|uniref:LuxR C-terminal-related transcriptional regulator n=1 Tax=Xanthomonas arboricola TaxID=56448 RepID=UPI000CEE84BA|nr:response regulator transcription factor [Xanthomonas arboricola]PPT30461.1 DNA-binding response regulator [Xanthomonas arboricola]